MSGFINTTHSPLHLKALVTIARKKSLHLEGEIAAPYKMFPAYVPQ